MPATWCPEGQAGQRSDKPPPAAPDAPESETRSPGTQSTSADLDPPVRGVAPRSTSRRRRLPFSTGGYFFELGAGSATHDQKKTILKPHLIDFDIPAGQRLDRVG